MNPIMDRDTSFLFVGTKFNRKNFANDFARFNVKKTSNVEAPELSIVETDNAEPEEEKLVSKKRKRKGKANVSDVVDGFNVFKTSKKSKAVIEPKEETEDDVSLRNKKLNKKIEEDNVFRKKHSLHVTGNNVPSPLKDFAELSSRYGCEEYLLSNLAELGFEEPTPIQRQAIPILLSGRECFACAPTGSGKTFAFVCPMLMKLKDTSKDGVRAVILCPTRELSAQSTRECKKLAKGKKFRIKLMTKELARSSDFSKLHCDVLISTPLRLQYAIRKRKLDLSRVEFLVLDESDKLFELGLVKQIDFVVKKCSNPSIVRSLFSATLPEFVEELARSIMHDAVRVVVGTKNSASTTIKQTLVFVGSEEGKLIAIRQCFAKSWNPPVLVFVQSKERAKELHGELEFARLRVDVIHSDLSQAQRENAVDDFRAGKTWVLIATDVISRGMDFKGVNCVINYDFPDSAAAYIHRIGRSGRAGREGQAITFYTEADVPYLKNIANVMIASGCKDDVPGWIQDLTKQKWKKHRPKRERISTEVKEKNEIQDLTKQKWKKHMPKRKRVSTEVKGKNE